MVSKSLVQYTNPVILGNTNMPVGCLPRLTQLQFEIEKKKEIVRRKIRDVCQCTGNQYPKLTSENRCCVTERSPRRVSFRVV